VVQGKKNTNKSFEHTLNITKQAPLFMEPTASFFCKEKRLRKEGGEEALAGSLLVAPKASKAIDGWMEDRWEDELLFPFPLQDKLHPILSCHFSSSSSLLLLKLKHPSPTTYYYSSPKPTNWETTWISSLLVHLHRFLSTPKNQYITGSKMNRPNTDANTSMAFQTLLLTHYLTKGTRTNFFNY